MYRLLFLLLLAAVFMVSCSDGEVCTQKVDTLLNASFYKINGNSVTDTALNNLTIYGLNHIDDKLYSMANNVNSIQVPLNPSATNSIFIFKTASGTDTLQISYTHKLVFISYECGFASNFEITKLDASYHLFDSVAIINKTMNRDNEENIEIYF